MPYHVKRDLGLEFGAGGNLDRSLVHGTLTGT